MIAPSNRPIRYRCDLPVRVSLDGVACEGTVIDLSEVGAFIACDLDVQVGDRVRLLLHTPDGLPFESEAQVIRLGVGQRELSRQGLDHLTLRVRGVGVRFLASGAERSVLLPLLDQLEER